MANSGPPRMQPRRWRTASIFKLSEEERSARLPSGIQTYIMNRTGWAGFHLDLAGLVTRPKRGRWQITDEGRIKSFRDYMNRRTKLRGRETVAADSTTESGAEISPEERIANAFSELRSQLTKDLLGIVRRMDPVRFERLVLDVLLAMSMSRGRPLPSTTCRKAPTSSNNSCIAASPPASSAIAARSPARCSAANKGGSNSGADSCDRPAF